MYLCICVHSLNTSVQLSLVVLACMHAYSVTAVCMSAHWPVVYNWLYVLLLACTAVTLYNFKIFANLLLINIIFVTQEDFEKKADIQL